MLPFVETKWPHEYSCTDQVTTKWPHSANTTESGFEIGCTWSDMHEMSNNFLMMINPNSLDKIQHYGNTEDHKCMMSFEIVLLSVIFCMYADALITMPCCSAEYAFNVKCDILYVCRCSHYQALLQCRVCFQCEVWWWIPIVCHQALPSSQLVGWMWW